MRRYAAAVLMTIVSGGTLYAQQPSLRATLDWMKQTLAPRGLTYMDRNGFSFYSAAKGFSYREVISDFSYQGCRVRIVKDTEETDPIFFKQPFRSQYIETFSLSDIDPESVTLDAGSGGSLHGVTFSTTDGRKLIHCSAINKNPGPNFDKDAGCMPRDDDSEGLRFSTSEYAHRFRKALKHTVVLCGGKPSVF